jgi:hypothetical protein
MRFQAVQAAWRRVRIDLRDVWDDAAGRLHDALDSGLGQGDLNRFTKRACILAAAIGNREPILAGPGLTLYAATKVMSEVLQSRDEQARQAELMFVLARLDSLDDDQVEEAS